MMTSSTRVPAASRRGRRPLAMLALLPAVLLAMPSATSARVDVGGAGFEQLLAVGADDRLALQGATVYRYMLFKVYAAGLYLQPGTPTARTLDADTARRLELVYFRDIAAADLERAAWHVLERSHAAAELERLRPRIERLHGWYRDVRAGDRFGLTWLPGRGTTLSLNGEELGTVEGEDFSAAYFGIWLGSSPIDSGMRTSLLSGEPPVDGSTQ